MYRGRVLLAVALFVGSVAGTTRTVGQGSPDSCTEASLDTQIALLTSGDELVFDCGPDTHAISISSFKWIKYPDITVDGGGLVVIDANHVTRHFVILFDRSGQGQQGNGQGQGHSFGKAKGHALTLSEAAVTLRGLHLRRGRSGGPTTWQHPGSDDGDDGGTWIFANLVRARDGGSIYVGREVALTLDNVTVEGSESRAEENDPQLSLNGGALHLSDLTETVIRDSVFLDNTAEHEGGAVMALLGATSLTISNTLFLRNRAFATGAQGGGALFVEGAELSCDQCDFRENEGLLGGAIRTKDTSTRMRDCVFSKNLAGRNTTSGALDAPGRGGAMYFHGSGAIGSSSARRLDITGCHVEENEAAEKGGGIYLCLGDADVANITDTVFCANKISPVGAWATTGAALQRGCGGGRLSLTEVTMGGNMVPSGDSTWPNGTFSDVASNGVIENSDIPGVTARSGDPISPPGPACPIVFCDRHPGHCPVEEETEEEEEEEEENEVEAGEETTTVSSVNGEDENEEEEEAEEEENTETGGDGQQPIFPTTDDANNTLQCLSVQSQYTGGGSESADSIWVACPSGLQLFGCMSQTQDFTTSRGHNLELRHGKMACVAYRALPAGSDVRAVARCCRLSPGGSCSYVMGAESGNQAGDGSQAECSAGHMTSCGAFGEAGYPGNALPLTESAEPGVPVNTFGICEAIQGAHEKATGGDTGLFAQAVCCEMSRLQCKAISSEVSLDGGRTVAQCTPEWTPTGCGVASASGEGVAAWGVRGRCVAQSPLLESVQAVILCCTVEEADIVEPVDPDGPPTSPQPLMCDGKTCENGGTLLDLGCRCSCTDEYQGATCTQLREEARNGVKLTIGDSKWERIQRKVMRPIVQSINTYCNDEEHFAECCPGLAVSDRPFDPTPYIGESDVQLAQGFPFYSQNDLEVMILVEAEPNNPLCTTSNGTTSARRKRSMTHRHTRAVGGSGFMPQDSLLNGVAGGVKQAADENGLNIGVTRGQQEPPVVNDIFQDTPWMTPVVVAMAVVTLIATIVAITSACYARHWVMGSSRRKRLEPPQHRGPWYMDDSKLHGRAAMNPGLGPIHSPGPGPSPGPSQGLGLGMGPLGFHGALGPPGPGWGSRGDGSRRQHDGGLQRAYGGVVAMFGMPRTQYHPASGLQEGSYVDDGQEYMLPSPSHSSSSSPFADSYISDVTALDAFYRR